VTAIRKATDEKGLARLRRMRAAAHQIWPLFEAEGIDGDLAGGAQLLRERLENGTYYQATVEVDQALKSLETAYRSLYRERHKQRQAAFAQAVDDVKAQGSWLELFPPVSEEEAHKQKEMQGALLKPLTDRAGHDLDLPEEALVCRVCGASLAQMASDLAAMARLRSDVLLRVQELATPEERVERVRVSDVVGVGQALGTSEEVDEVLAQLRDHLVKLIALGVKVVLE